VRVQVALPSSAHSQLLCFHLTRKFPTKHDDNYDNKQSMDVPRVWLDL
jgi:hypothetical protein